MCGSEQAGGEKPDGADDTDTRARHGSGPGRWDRRTHGPEHAQATAQGLRSPDPGAHRGRAGRVPRDRRPGADDGSRPPLRRRGDRRPGRSGQGGGGAAPRQHEERDHREGHRLDSRPGRRRPRGQAAAVPRRGPPAGLGPGDPRLRGSPGPLPRSGRGHPLLRHRGGHPHPWRRGRVHHRGARALAAAPGADTAGLPAVDHPPRLPRRRARPAFPGHRRLLGGVEVPAGRADPRCPRRRAEHEGDPPAGRLPGRQALPARLPGTTPPNWTRTPTGRP
jgi:hypothetical protein